MTDEGAALYAEMLGEVEIPVGKDLGKARAGIREPEGWKVDQALVRIREAGLKGKLVLAYSGGADSTVLLDLAAAAKPAMVWVDTQMEYPGSREFVEDQAAVYGLELRTSRAKETPREHWPAAGWPMLGKMSARLWGQTHQDRGFRLNCAECCRTFKIEPARRLCRNLGAQVQLTGQRGTGESVLRRHRAHQDGPLRWNQRDRLWVASPLQGWTDEDVAGYTRARGLREHPWRARGAETIGCVYCGGGGQFENSGYRLLREVWPEAWKRFVVEWGGGEIILAVKYDARLLAVREAVKEAGGLERLARERAWIFDFLRRRPLKGRAM